MKNKDKKKDCKNCKNDNVVEKKVNTTQNGKEYYQEVENKKDENTSLPESNEE